VNGGVHIGGESAVADNNLLVDGCGRFGQLTVGTDYAGFGIDFRDNVAIGATQGNAYIINNAINSGYLDDTDSYSLNLNYAGKSAGVTKFRDTIIYNGKNGALMTFDGSSGISQCNYRMEILHSLYIGALSATDPGDNNLTVEGVVTINGLATANTGILWASAANGLIGATNIAAGTIPMGSATAGLAASILTQQTTASITNTGNFILNGTGAGQNIQRRGTTPWGPLDIIFWNGPSGNSPGVRILTGDGVHDDIAYAIERFRINSDAAVVDAVFSACNLLVNGTLKSTGAFGCNNVTPQTPVAYVANPTDLPTCISAMTAVLTMVKANGQMATS
jgi:hypothetical protein